MTSARELAGILPGYFKNDDFNPEKGGSGEAIYTISDCGPEEMGKDRETKPVLAFLETNKKLVLNKTRSRQLVDIFGDKALKGAKVKLAFRNEEVAGRLHGMICIDPVE